MADRALEQLMIELLNHARLNAEAEAARLGITDPAELAALNLPTGSLEVVAGNTQLQTSAQLHSQWMLETDRFGHTGEGGTNAGTRMENAGYEFTGRWYWGENIGYRASSGTLDQEAAVHHVHDALFLSEGHRRNMLNEIFREVGISVEHGDYLGYDAVMITQNLATTAERKFLTGVVFNDTDGDGFYSVGEGVGGAVFNFGGKSGITHSAGGYSIEQAMTGFHAVKITSGGIVTEATVDFGGGNVKLDLVNGRTLQTDTNMVLLNGAINARLLGQSDLNLTGNSAANELTGNTGANVISGGAGNDVLRGRASDDTLTGGAGDDTIIGGDGTDTAVINANADAVTVKETSDGILIISSEGTDVFRDVERFVFNDRAYDYDGLLNAKVVVESSEPGDMPGEVWIGSAADDVHSGTTLADDVRGGAGNDRLSGGAGFDTIFGGDGDDSAWGGDGRDIVYLGTGDDCFFDSSQGGDLGRDTVFAGDGNDMVEGGNGNDQFFGGNGNDLILGRLGDDMVFGGNGFDTLAGGDGNDSVWGGDGRDIAYLGAGDDVFHDNDQSGELGSDTVFAGYGNDTILGSAGNDEFHGLAGDDLIVGGSGDDSLFGGSGSDEIIAGEGNDRVWGGEGRDLVFLGDGDDAYFDSSQGGELGRDTVFSGAGQDSIFGGAGDDLYHGGAGDDVILGRLGNDTINGGTGNDSMEGGSGVDTFVFDTDFGADVVADFTKREDILRLDDALWAGSMSATQVVNTYGDDSSGTVVFDFGGGNVLTLEGVSSLFGIESDLLIF